MRDRVVWKSAKMDTEKFGKRTVYVKNWFVPFVGLMAAADTAFTVPAYIRYKGKKLTGFITPRDGMAFGQEHDSLWFVVHTGQMEKLNV